MVRIRYLKLKELVDTYYGHLRSTPFHVEYPHGNLVKSRIVKTYGETISFVDIVKGKGKFVVLLFYATDVSCLAPVVHRSSFCST